MDRQIVWPGAIPLETDILNTNRYAMVALGRLAMDVLGSATVASGLACTPTAVPSMAVNIGAGAIYSLQNIDNVAYSSLPADTTDQVLKQGILLASAGSQLSMTAPATSGNSVIYLIEAAYSEVDTVAVTLPYYNSASPAIPFSGPANNGQPSFTKRAGTVNVQAKAGVAGSSPLAPAADTGFVPLYYVAIAYGQTAITAANITLAPGAPFVNAGLAGLMPIAGGDIHRHRVRPDAGQQRQQHPAGHHRHGAGRGGGAHHLQHRWRGQLEAGPCQRVHRDGRCRAGGDDRRGARSR